MDNEDFKNWSDIYDEQILTEGYGSSAKHYLIIGDANSNYTKIDIVNLTTTASKLETILRTYRIRYNKNNKI